MKENGTTNKAGHDINGNVWYIQDEVKSAQTHVKLIPDLTEHDTSLVKQQNTKQPKGDSY